MAIDVILGLQWGDEGKGKIVDYLTPNYDVVARFQGGPNAGHTLMFGGEKRVLHQVPSGIFHAKTKNLIGNGMVIDPVVLKKEIEMVEKFGTHPRKNLFVAKKAHLILPTHRLLDAALEASKGKGKIGSTLRGIGPAYQDKTGRTGLRVGDIVGEKFLEKYRELVATHEKQIKFLSYEYDLASLEPEFFEAIEFMRTLNLVDGEYFINDEVAKGSRILAEGAQGTLLDIGFGSYPFVTSSHTISAGVCIGLGVPPSYIGEVLGVFKAYCTRVGSGPFPTELFDATGQAIQKQGNEFGSTTGRPRRCGWVDLPALRYACMINGVTKLIMMKADVLDMLDEIKVCTGYKLPDGSITNVFISEAMDNIEPVYTTLPGWKTSIENVQTFDDMPEELASYIAFLESELGVPVAAISTSPDREKTVFRNNIQEKALAA